MTVALILVLLAALALAGFLLQIRNKQLAPGGEANLGERLHPVDLEAFRNLIDPEEERYLRDNLPIGKFRGIQRQRLRAAVDYLAGVSHNAAILLQLGQIARRSPDPQIGEAGRNLVDTASRLRLYSLTATAKLYGRMLLPGARFETAPIVGQYEQMRDCAALLSRLRDPATAGLIPRGL
jgi:hypothetical protein